MAANGTSSKMAYYPLKNRELRPITATTSATYNIDDLDFTVIGDTTSGNITINLPVSLSNEGRVLVIKKSSALNTLTIDGDGSELVDGATTLAMTALNSITHLHCDGTEWIKIN